MERSLKVVEEDLIKVFGSLRVLTERVVSERLGETAAKNLENPSPVFSRQITPPAGR